MVPSAAPSLSSTSHRATPIQNSTLSQMRSAARIQFRALGAQTGTAYSKLCNALSGKCALTPDEESRVQKVLVRALRERKREIETLLKSGAD